ncbi:MAG TPA: hypothetical protein EYG13_06795 [Dehalococcoidia bacterium]|nr:hypothetical protein [Dehalococcoidia bacterium]
MNPKVVLDVGLCRLYGLAARRLHVDLADSVAPVRGVPPPASPAAVIGVRGAARLRNVAAPLAVMSWPAPRLRRHHSRSDDRDLHEIAALPARSCCLHPMSYEIGADLALARQLHFEEVVAAVLPLTDPCG